MKKLAFTLLLTALLLVAHGWREFSLATQLAPTPQPGRVSSLVRPDGLVQPAFSGCGGENTSLVNADYEQQVVEMVNDARADQGLAPLKRSEPFDQAARYHATDLGQDDYFDHDTYDREGSEIVFVCNTWQRIEAYTSGANAENIAAGYSDPPEVMEAWMSSSGHQDNILNTYSWELGIGYYEGSGLFPNYWVQDFGRRDDVYPLIINGEDSSTDSPSVSLYIYGDWQEMRLRNDNGVWTDWQPFQTVIGWTLHDGAGDHTVTAELMAGSQTATSSDTIYLNADSSQPALGNLPNSLSFLFSIPDQKLVPQVHLVTPLNQGNSTALDWQVTLDGLQFNSTPSTGSTPGSISVGVENFDQQTPATYSGTLTVTVTDPLDVNGSPHVIELTLRVVETSFQPLYLPLLNK